MSAPTPTLVAEGLSKRFSGVPVLQDVSLRLSPGEVVGLIGQNGSGKSTLIKILSGYHSPEAGAQVRMSGQDITSHLGAGPARTGMAFIHQDLALIPSMTIVENLRIARFSTGFARRIRWREERAHVRATLRQVGLDVSPDVRVGDLSVTERGLVAIARGLAETALEDGERGRSSRGGGGGRLLVLDEPTAYLPREGVERLFGVVQKLSSEGVSVLFVSHRLDEVLEHCDRVLVLRGGELVADVPVHDKSEHDLVELMLGRPAEQMYPEARERRNEPALAVRELRAEHARGLSFEAGRGEIVGFVGLPGGGYDALPYLLTGALPCTSGEVVLDGERLAAEELTPGRAVKTGIVLLPADRKGASGALGVDVQDNMTLPTLPSYTSSRMVLRAGRERQAVTAELDRFDVRPRRGDVPLAALSGGNQQKVLLAKWLLAAPRVLALHEPTQGVDVGAKRDVFAHLARLARDGAVILISSVEYEDLAHLCTRVHVVRDGAVIRTLEREALTAHAVAAAVYAAPEAVA